MILVTGAGGFIGGHLVKRLLEDGHEVRAVDVKPYDEWYQLHPEARNLQRNLQSINDCLDVTRPDRGSDLDRVFNLAADMGGMGFIENNKLMCMLSVLTSTHMLMAAARDGAGRFFYASSACVYAADKQTDTNVTALKESDAYPAMAEDGYGWEKLFTERMCRHFTEDRGLVTRVARYHNVYGPYGTYEGGREKAPAAICRKVVDAKLSGNHEIEIWGDGEQTRSFMHISDCVEGTLKITESEIDYPINLGSAELVSINQLVSIAEDIAGVYLDRRYNLSAPQGVRGRNSDNTLIRKELGWEPSTQLRDGMEELYRWIWDQRS